jgi:hypothetical protein
VLPESVSVQPAMKAVEQEPLRAREQLALGLARRSEFGS